MKKTLYVLAAIAPFSIAAAQDLQPWQTKALEEVKSEASVIDAYWRSAESNVLYIARKFDGTRQDGFAEYLCLVINNDQAPEGALKTIQVFDPVGYEQAKTASAEAMGMAVCR